MKRLVLIILIFFATVVFIDAAAQCSICTKTAQQLGEKPAKALNSAIVYLAFTPFLIVGYIGYKWYKKNR